MNDKPRVNVTLRDNADQKIQNEIYKDLHRRCRDYCRGKRYVAAVNDSGYS
jgi:hypothetical protein